MTHFQYLEPYAYVMATFSECSPAFAAPQSSAQRGCHGESSRATVITPTFVPVLHYYPELTFSWWITLSLQHKPAEHVLGVKSHHLSRTGSQQKHFNLGTYKGLTPHSRIVLCIHGRFHTTITGWYNLTNIFTWLLYFFCTWQTVV